MEDNNNMMVARSTTTMQEDGTFTALLKDPPISFGTAHLLRLHLLHRTAESQQPLLAKSAPLAGRYFLVRCGVQTPEERAENWQYYLRRPLFVAGLRLSATADTPDEWHLNIPHTNDPGYRWLLERQAGESLNLLGPFGNGFAVNKMGLHLLLISDAQRFATLLPLIEQVLDAKGRVVVLITGGWPTETLKEALPIPVELRITRSEAELISHLTETLRWAEQLAVALPMTSLPLLAQKIKEQRFRLNEGFAHVLVEADLVCGVGACLACVVPTANDGYTRACVHGPVFDLSKL